MIAFFAKLAFGGLGLAKRGLALLGKLNIWQILCIGLFMAAALFYVQRNNARDDLDTARINLRECRQGRIDDRKAYEDAQRKAHEANLADVARKEAESQRISNERQADLNARLERLRSELRKPGSAKGSAGRPGISETRPATPGTDGPPALCLSSEELLRAAEDEERHDQLITWVEQQLGVKR